ncbi:hypothetical protein, partial [Stutzerimonas stutzeri]|uniref:hypothetical protein n=1 Tax=Stutzerimonas stutzeri TaxID=316 RepID=UPI001F1EDF6B
TTELGYRREDSKATALINLSTVADAEISNPTGSISHQRQHFKLSIDDLCHDWKCDECLEMRLALVCQGCPLHVSCVAGGDHSIPSSRIGWLSLTTINGLFRFSSANMAMEPPASATGTAPCGSSLPTQTYCRVSKHAR